MLSVTFYNVLWSTLEQSPSRLYRVLYKFCIIILLLLSVIYNHDIHQLGFLCCEINLSSACEAEFLLLLGQDSFWHRNRLRRLKRPRKKSDWRNLKDGRWDKKWWSWSNGRRSSTWRRRWKSGKRRKQSKSERRRGY